VATTIKYQYMRTEFSSLLVSCQDTNSTLRVYKRYTSTGAAVQCRHTARDVKED